MSKKIADFVIVLLISGVVVTLVLEMVPVSRGALLTIAILAILYLWHEYHNPPKRRFWTFAALALVADVVLVLADIYRTPTVVAETPVDPQGMCFIDFLVWHHDQKMALTARVQNRNKQPVQYTLIRREFSLMGFPPSPEQEVPENRTLYPEMGYSTFDSYVVVLGKDVPAGTVLPGRVNFLLRFGPHPNNSAILKIKGLVYISVGTEKDNHDGVRFRADPDSTPDCPGVDKLIGQDF